MPTDDRLARLPAWARNEILRLRDSLDDRDRQLAQIAGTEPGGRIRLVDYGRDAEVRVPDHMHVMFDFGPERIAPDGHPYVSDYVEVSHDGDRLRVRSSGSAIAVHPSGSNSIAVTLDAEGKGSMRYGGGDPS
jgi:hypothetical protein